MKRKPQKWAALALALTLAVSFGARGAAAPVTAKPTKSTVLVNGANKAFDAYNISDSNYFKLRDLAYVLNGTEKQFSVGYDDATKAITLTSGQAYTPVGGEMTGKGAENKTPTPTSSKIYLDGKDVSFTAYIIEGNNYFKLRDVGIALNFGVNWDAANSTIVIDTSEGYPAPGGDIGFFDPDFDYTQNPRYKVIYVCIGFNLFNEDFNNRFAHWASLSNVQYDGYWSASSNDELVEQLPKLREQGYDGVLLEPDIMTYPRIAEVCDEIELHWMGCMGQPFAFDETMTPTGLLHPYVGFDSYGSGQQAALKLIEYKNQNWPDVPWEKIAMYALDFSVSLPLHDRIAGARDAFMEKVGREDSFLVDDTILGLLDVGTAYQYTLSAVASNSQFTHWLVVTPLDDFAQGAAKAFDELGMTDNGCVVSVGDATPHTQWDAGRQDAWRFSLTVPDILYSEPIFFALYAFMSGQAAPETIWREWVNHNNTGSASFFSVFSETYAQLLMPSYWAEYGSYKRYLAWTDVYSGANDYPDYSRDGLTRDSYPARAAVPESYR
jgi:hypothetical protein